MANGEKDKIVAGLAQLGEGHTESFEQDFPVMNQGWRGFGQVPGAPGKHGFVRQQLEQRLKLTSLSRAEEFRDDALILLPCRQAGGFLGRNPLPSASQDL